jgi:hypothetical protein
MDLETSMTLVAPVLAIVAGIDIRSMVVIAAMMTTFPFLAFAERGPLTWLPAPLRLAANPLARTSSELLAQLTS